MKLLMITQDFPPSIGGVQSYSVELARQLAPRCERFALVTVSALGSRRTDRDLPFPVTRIPSPSSAMGAVAPALVPLLTNGTSYDAVLHSQWYTLAAGLLLRRLGRVKGVFAAAHGRELLVNGLAGNRLGGAAFDAARRALIRRTDGLFPVSAYTATLLHELGADPSKVHVVHNGTDPLRFRPVDGRRWRAKHGLDRSSVMMTVARIVHRKGIDTVIDALPSIVEVVRDVVYVVVGSGPEQAALELRARERGVSDRVVFVGSIPSEERAECLSACDVFVMPARNEPPEVEGFGLVYLEAGACARPVVGARAGGVPEAVLHEETGLVVEPDDPAGLAKACIRILTDVELASRLGRQGRERVEATGSWARAAERVLQTIEQVT